MLGRLDIQLLGPPVGEALTPRIREGEAFRVTIRALTADLAASTPTTMRYKLIDSEQGANILDWTSLSPATSVNVIVTAAQNAMRNGLPSERRQFVAEASDSDGPIRRIIDYIVEDIAAT